MEPGGPERVTIIDYGLGNLFSLQRALAHLGVPGEVTEDPGKIRDAVRLILPGVGAFGDGMQQLRARGLVAPLLEAASRACPLLGICLGMQLLFTESEEFGRHEGLDLIRGRVRRLHPQRPDGRRVKVPHVGWSALRLPPGRSDWSGASLRRHQPGEAMYFVHSYVPCPESESVVTAVMEYGGRAYCAVVESGSLLGVQFHPEKSGEPGLRLLKQFVERPHLERIGIQ